MLHRCNEGERVGVDGSKIVDLDHRPDHCPGGTPAPPEARGREPPYFIFILGLPPRWEGEFPLWSLVSMVAEGREPLRDWISLSVLFCFAFPRSARKPFLIFPEIRNSDCAEILTRFFTDISFLVPEVEPQPTYEVSTTHHGTPGSSGAPWWFVPTTGRRLR